MRRTLIANPAIRIASFSHITSVPAIILPVKQLTRLCKQHGVLVLIDGAHALGQIRIDVQDIGADFYVANGRARYFFYFLEHADGERRGPVPI